MLVSPSQHTLQHISVYGGVAHDAASADLISPRLKLRLDQRYNVSIRFQPAGRDLQEQRQ